jgi:hypothetical protein
MKVPISNASNLLSQQCDEDNVWLFHHILTLSFLLWWQVLKTERQRDHGLAAITCRCQHLCVQVALHWEACKPICWFHYIDDTLVIWTHGPEKLNDFLNHLNSNIQFTTDTESDGSLGHNVYRKLTHTNLYLNAKSPHHLVSKCLYS